MGTIREAFVLTIIALMTGSIPACAQQTGPPSNPSPADQAQSGAPPQKRKDIYQDPKVKEEIEEVREELVDADYANFRSRVTFKYNYKFRPADVSSQRIRLRGVYSFGPKKRYAVASQVPFKFESRDGNTVSGLGDVEFQTGMIFHEGERYAHGGGVQFNAATATAPALGGDQATFKVLYGGSITVTPKWYLSFSFNYATPIWTKMGPGVKEIEPEVDLARALPWFTAYVHWDNYYDWPQPDKWENTIKFGGSRLLGKRKLWNLNLYCELPFDAQSRKGFDSNWGFDLTRYF